MNKIQNILKEYKEAKEFKVIIFMIIVICLSIIMLIENTNNTNQKSQVVFKAPKEIITLEYQNVERWTKQKQTKPIIINAIKEAYEDEIIYENEYSTILTLVVIDNNMEMNKEKEKILKNIKANLKL